MGGCRVVRLANDQAIDDVPIYVDGGVKTVNLSDPVHWQGHRLLNAVVRLIRVRDTEIGQLIRGSRHGISRRDDEARWIAWLSRNDAGARRLSWGPIGVKRWGCGGGAARR